MGYVFNHYTEIIDVTAPQTTVEIQELYTAIRVEEYENLALAYAKICDGSGKANLGGGVVTGITLYLYPNWQIRFWEGTYIATVQGGNIIGGLNNMPFAYTPGVQIQINQSASSTLVYGTGGLTQSEHDKLMTGLDISIPDNVWDELLAGHAIQGSAGQTVSRAARKATLASLK